MKCYYSPACRWKMALLAAAVVFYFTVHRRTALRVGTGAANPPQRVVAVVSLLPPLDEMNEYELDGSRLVPREGPSGNADTLNQEWRVQRRKPVNRTGALSIEQVLSAARARLRRLSPNEAYEAMVNPGAILVDIRPEGQRAIEGSIAGALVVERNVLEWRFDPASSARLPVATDHDVQVIVFCSEGYTSSLAAAALQDLGLWRATDIVGGFQEWCAAGLPIVRPGKSY